MSPTTRQQETDLKSENHHDDNPDNDDSNGRSNGADDAWKHDAPYRIHKSSDDFNPVWHGMCHCGRVKYQLCDEKPLKSKYCHCTTCQRLHGAPLQHSSIFPKTSINFTSGHHSLAFYDPGSKSLTHHLPCKVSCSYCRTPIMDEGRNMILLFPTLIDGINEEKGKKAFRVDAHIFYGQRALDVKDGVEKWEGLDKKSRRLGEEGEILDDGPVEEEVESEDNAKKRKRESNSQTQAKKEAKT